VANEVVFDGMEGVGAFAAEFVDALEKARLDGEAGLGVRAIDGLQGRLRRVEDDTAQAALDLAEQPMLDRVPLERCRAGSGPPSSAG
jgi:hypothetical protein